MTTKLCQRLGATAALGTKARWPISASCKRGLVGRPIAGEVGIHHVLEPVALLPCCQCRVSHQGAPRNQMLLSFGRVGCPTVSHTSHHADVPDLEVDALVAFICICCHVLGLQCPAQEHQHRGGYDHDAPETSWGRVVVIYCCS